MSAQIDQLLHGSAAGKPKRAPAIDDLLKICSRYLPHEEVEQVHQAYLFAAEAHKGQVRLSHEDYITHPVASAITLADLKMDPTTLKAALLHDVPWDTSIPLSTLEKRFGKDVAHLVDGATKLNRLAVSDSDEHSRPPETGAVDSRAWAEGLRKMFIAMAEDSRVLLVKLAERLNNMESLSFLPKENRRQIASETLDIYAPLAGRLGIGQLKWQLEDWSLHYLDPEKYKEIATLLASRCEAREECVADVFHRLNDAIGNTGIAGELTGRPKHIYSIYRKMMERGVGFDQIYDLAAVRVIVDKNPECYLVLGVVHCLWPPIPGQARAAERIQNINSISEPTALERPKHCPWCSHGQCPTEWTTLTGLDTRFYNQVN